MITDDRARLLLTRAAETIDVDEPDADSARGPISRPAWRMPLAVAAAVLLVIGAGLALGRLAPDVGPAPADRRTGEPVEQPYAPDPGELPGLIGYTAEEARDELTDRGLRVVEQPVRTYCEPDGIVTSTTPGQAAAVEPGDTITLRVTDSAPVIDCTGEPPWEAIYGLVRFARGLDDEPPVDDALRLTVNGRDAVTLTAEDAADPDAWTVCPATGSCHSALGALEELLTQPWTANGRPVDPGLVVSQGRTCGDQRNDVQLSVEIPQTGGVLPRGGRAPCPRPSVSFDIAVDDVGVVSAVDVTTASNSADDGDPATDHRLVARQLVAWARDPSQEPPPFAREVTVAVADAPVRTVSASRAAKPVGLEPCRICSSAMYASARTLLRQYRGPIAYSTIPATACVGRDETPPEVRDAAEAGRMIRIDQPEPRSCAAAFAVELTLDDEGAIERVNTFPPTG